MQKTFLIISGFFAMTAVGLGAFGAHALKESLSAESLQAYETGVRYQFYHTFALITLGLLPQRWFGAQAKISGYLFIAGILLFSGSLYLLTVAELRIMGPVTPAGGLCLIAGWILFMMQLIRPKASF